MTLILSVATQRRVIQASDRLTTWPDGSVHNPVANKAIIVTCSDAYFAIGFTGAALVGTIPTDEWLGDYLSDFQAPKKCLRDIVTNVIEQGRNYQSRFSDPRLSMILCGYYGGKAFTGLISNFETWRTPRKSNSPAIFQTEYFYERDSSSTSKPPLAVSIHGRSDLVSEAIHARLKRLRKTHFFQNAKSEEVEDRLVAIIRDVAKQNDSRVGRDCLTVTVPRNPNVTINIRYHASDYDPVIYGAYIVHPLGSIKNFSASISPDSSIVFFPHNADETES